MAVKPWLSYAPALFVSIVILMISGVLGGPIAVAIASFLVLPTLIGTTIVTFLVRLKYKPAKLWPALLVSLGSYLTVTSVVLLLVDWFGPTQIM